MNFFFSRIADDPVFVVSWCAVIAFSICVHEYAHAWTALRLGDDTAARQGHLSLNPMVQMGGMSLLLLALFGLAWGAVPVDPARLRTAGRAAAVAVAGPLANLALVLLFTGLLVGSTFLPVTWQATSLSFFRLAALANGVLCLFNLLPIPMFDGWTVLAAVVKPMRRIDPLRVQSWSWLLILAVWVTPVGGYIWEGSSALVSRTVLVWAGLARWLPA